MGAFIHEDMLNDIDIKMNVKSSNYTFNGYKVPRVTEILGFIDTQDLLGWANYMGLKHQKYRDIMNEASSIGTRAHNNIEKYLKGEKVVVQSTAYEGFLLWWNQITAENKVEVLGQEETLVCEYFGGTYDMLMSINGKVYLVDFKTSNHVGYKYFMQLAAYRYMLYRCKGISISGCIVLQLDKNIPGFQEYLLNFENKDEYDFIESCTRSFFSLVGTYYYVYDSKTRFTDIFNSKER